MQKFIYTIILAASLPAIGCGQPSAKRVGEASSALTITPVARVNFQPATAAVPAGYTADTGAGYDDARGSGFVREDSLATTHVVLDLTPNTRSRGRAGIDPRLDTIIQLQYPAAIDHPGAVKTRAAWEYKVPAGRYRVRVAVGDMTPYDSQHTIHIEGVAAITLFQSTAASEYKQASIDVDVNDGRLTIDAVGGTNTKLDFVDIDRLEGTPAGTPIAKIDFEPATSPVPAGYVADTGLPFEATRGFGWFRQDSLPSSPVALDLSPNTRDRARTSIDVRQNTFIHMQYPASFNRPVAIPGAWEYVIPNGTYRVTFSVGDQPSTGANYDSQHTIRAEGRTLLKSFQGSAEEEYRVVSTDVTVLDGRLTLDSSGGYNTKLNYVDIAEGDGFLHPWVTTTSPPDGATGVDPTGFVSAELRLTNSGGGIDKSTLGAGVSLVDVATSAVVPAIVNTSGGGDVIVLKPSAPLRDLATYRFVVSSSLFDSTGVSFLPSSTTFTTGTAGTPPATTVAFDKIALTTATGRSFTSVAVGPDHRLYAATLEGDIVRFALAADGTTGPADVIPTVRNIDGPRAVIGLAFDPAATASNLVLWVTHSAVVPVAPTQAPDWAGKLSRLSGPALATKQDYVVGLPRSIRDHMTNSLAFRPGEPNSIYIVQGSMSATGAPDNAWIRAEHQLSAAVLRVNLAAIQSPPLNVQTEDGGTYDAFAAGAPVTIYASGVRNAYDLVFHTNGQLYVATNGSAADGNSPSTTTSLPAACARRIDAAARGPYTGPSITGLSHIATAQSDYLYRVVAGGYYGHPNPQRCEWVLNGGNPTPGVDGAEIPEYPAGVLADRNYRGFAYDFGLHYSPDGALEYKSSVFGSALQGKLLVARYSGGKDIVALTPGGPSLDIVASQSDIPGLTGFLDPLDIAEDVGSGSLYVTELAGQRITLLKPHPMQATSLAFDAARLIFTDVVGGAASALQTITLVNGSSAAITVTGVSVSGPDAATFAVTSGPTFPLALAPSSSLPLRVTFAPIIAGPRKASLDAATSTGTVSARLRGLGTRGTGGANEPSLQWILDTYDIPVASGDPDPTTTDFPDPSVALVGDEVAAPRFVKGANGPVTVETIAVFGLASTPAVRVGWNIAGVTSRKFPLLTVAPADAQRLAPPTTPSGVASFDPGAAAFGFYTIWPGFADREVFTNDADNGFNGNLRHHARAYRLKNEMGAVVPNAYVIAFEEFTTSFDFQDFVAIVRNVAPVSTPKISIENLDAAPFADRLATSRIGGDPPQDQVHKESVLRVYASGAAPLVLSSANVTGPFVLVALPTFPVTLPVGTFLDLTAELNATTGIVKTGSMTLASNDPGAASVPIELAGAWQSAPEGNNEPTLAQLVSVFGYATVITKPGQVLNHQGHVEAVGDEVLAPYWRARDVTLPVTVHQLAAYHTQGNRATISSFVQGTSTTTAIVTHDPRSGQTILPRKDGSTTLPAIGSFKSTEVFGFKIDSEWSDPAKNNSAPDIANGCTLPCGHHLRVWPAKDRAGNVIAGSYLMSMDYSGINYDYNDNLFLVTNVTPP